MGFFITHGANALILGKWRTKTHELNEFIRIHMICVEKLMMSMINRGVWNIANDAPRNVKQGIRRQWLTHRVRCHAPFLAQHYYFPENCSLENVNHSAKPKFQKLFHWITFFYSKHNNCNLWRFSCTSILNPPWQCPHANSFDPITRERNGKNQSRNVAYETFFPYFYHMQCKQVGSQYFACGNLTSSH